MHILSFRHVDRVDRTVYYLEDSDTMDEYRRGRADCKTLIVHDEVVELVRKTIPAGG